MHAPQRTESRSASERVPSPSLSSMPISLSASIVGLTPSIVSAARSSCGSMKPDLSTSKLSNAFFTKSTLARRFFWSPQVPILSPCELVTLKVITDMADWSWWWLSEEAVGLHECNNKMAKLWRG